MAGVALADMDLHFAWQAWHLVTWTCTLRGKRGAYGTGLVLVTRSGAACRGLATDVTVRMDPGLGFLSKNERLFCSARSASTRTISSTTLHMSNCSCFSRIEVFIEFV